LQTGRAPPSASTTQGAMARDKDGSILVANSGNNAVLRVTMAGELSKRVATSAAMPASRARVTLRRNGWHATHRRARGCRGRARLVLDERGRLPWRIATAGTRCG
jgi:hypothetical protein